MAVAAGLDGRRRNVVCVIGDGAMSAGMAYEAMNNAGAMKARLVVILNDNDMSIAPPVGAMSAYLSRVITQQRVPEVPAHRQAAVDRTSRAGCRPWPSGPRSMRAGWPPAAPCSRSLASTISARSTATISTTCCRCWRTCATSPRRGPVLIHVVTQKGKGYPPAEAASDKYHGVNRFDVITGTQVKAKSNAPALTTVFAERLVREAARDPKIVAVTAAMPSGTGLNLFQKAFPERCFDVGIAEQHAVTFAAGLAAEGYRPFCAIYSTFLQRAYDQVVHDVAIQDLPVRFALDRAGLVGADGATHAGSFDVAYLGCLPNFVLMAAADEAELVHMVATAARHDAGPIALRYPRGEGVGLDLPRGGTAAPDRQGPDRPRGQPRRPPLLRQPPRRLPEGGRGPGPPRPLDHGGRRPFRQASGHRPDPRARPPPPGPAHGRGGLDRRLRQLRAAVHARRRPARRRAVRLRSLVLPDRYIDQGTPQGQLAEAGLDARGIVAAVMRALGAQRPVAVRAGAA